MKSRRLQLIGLLLAMGCLAGWPLAASAHILKSDGAIQALLHVKPDDEPVAGKVAGLWFEFTDSKNKFSALACDCRITIKDGSRTLLDRSTTAGEAESASVIQVDYTLPRRAVYTVTIAGKPRVAGAFQSFKLEYDVRVDHGDSPSTPPLVVASIVVLIAAAVGAMGFFVYRELRYGGKG